MLEERTASRCFGVFPVRRRLASGRRGQPGAARRGRARRRRRCAARDRPVPAPVERDRFPAADMGRLDHVARCEPLRFHHPARQQEHHRRSGMAAGDRSGRLDSRAASRAARRSSASAAAIRCWDERSAIRTAWSRRSDAAEGLGLLPAATELGREKRTRAVSATTPGGVRSAATRSISASRRSIAATTSRRLRRLERWQATTASAAQASSAPTCTARSSIRRCAPRSSASRPPSGRSSKADGQYRAAGGLVRARHGRGISTGCGTRTDSFTEDTTHALGTSSAAAVVRSAAVRPLSRRRPEEPHQVLSTSVRNGGQVDLRPSPVESSELRRRRAPRAASRHDRGRSRRLPRSRLRRGGAAGRATTAVMGTAANMNYVAVVDRGR